MLIIYSCSIFQDKRIKKLFPIKKKEPTRTYNKEKKAKYENHLRKLGLIAFDERFLNCNANKTFSKIYRLNFQKSSSTINVGVYHYNLRIPKSLHLKYFSFKHKAELNHYKTINLKYLNQKVSIHIWDDTFYYYIETFMKLPYYSKSTRYAIKKQIDYYILKLLREGKLVKRGHAVKILKNKLKHTKKALERESFNKGHYSVLTLLRKSEQDKFKDGLRLLSFRKTEILFFHNTILEIYLYDVYYHRLKGYIEGLDIDLSSEYIGFSLEKGYLLLRLKRSINDNINGYFNNVRDLFIRFLDIGITEITTILGIDNKIFYNNIRALNLRSSEVARKLNHFDKTKSRDIPILRYGKNRKRDLGFIGYENYYDYIDNSDGLEYEIQYFNRKQKTIPDIVRDLDYLLDFKPIIENGIFKIEPISLSGKSFRNGISIFKNTIYEIRDFDDLVNIFTTLYINRFVKNI